MKKFAIAIIALFAFTASSAQLNAMWSLGKADTADILAGNMAPNQHVAAASTTGALWGMLQNLAMNYSSFYFGNYKLTEYNNAGLPGSSATITGKLYLAYAKADADGNWYVSGQYYDSVNFPGGPSFVNPTPSSTTPYFVAKFNSGSLTCAWAKITGSSTAFTIANNGLYALIDSDMVTHISKFDIATGERTDVLTQPFRSYTTSIAVDETGNIYLAGGCAFSGIDFNGHIVSTTGIPYPVYIVKYRGDGTYAWHHLMSDVTCPERQLTVADNNIIYYSGKIFDTFSLGGFFLHHPAWVYDYLVSRLDSSGNISWVTQLKDTLAGDARADNNCHAVAMPDSSLSVFAEIRGYVDWGNGVVTPNDLSHTKGGIVNYSPAGVVNWVKLISGNTISSRNITGNGNDVWVTGNIYDSSDYHLDGITVPVVPLTFTPFIAKLHTEAYTPAGLAAGPEDPEQVLIMPVPATNLLTIQIPSTIKGNVRIRLTDISGSKVLDKNVENVTTTQIDVSTYSRGIYFIDISGNCLKTFRKIILQ